MVTSPEAVTVEPPPLPLPLPLGIALVDATFLHWPYDPALVRPLLPAGTAPDTHDGATYVGLIAFRIRAFGEFLETNVRLYSVDQQGRRGIVFLSMDADRLPWVLAGRAAGLPYAWSRMHAERDVHVVSYSSSRRWPGQRGISNRIRVRVGQPIEGAPLDHFLTARWRLHHAVAGVTLTVPLSHDRWPLHTAQLVDLDDELVAATGLPAPTTPPTSVLYAPAVQGRLGLPDPL